MNIGTDVRIANQAVIVRPELVEIGDHVAIDPFTVITTALKLGSYIHIASHCSIVGGQNGLLEMRDYSSLAAGCRIICSSDDYAGHALNGATIPLKYRSVTSTKVLIERFASIATNVIVFPGVTIGEGAVVAAGGIVNRDIEPWGIYFGSPVRRVGTRPADKMLAYAAEIEQQRD
jgi:acetyltransferase-like isoleucine patch superfamily enzyme